MSTTGAVKCPILGEGSCRYLQILDLPDIKLATDKQDSLSIREEEKKNLITLTPDRNLMEPTL